MAEEVGENYNPEQEVEIGNFKICDLKPEEEKVKENASELFKARSKVYLWDKDSSEWKERGVGNVIIIRNEDDN
jgi:Ran-binding protein 1